MGSAFSAVPEQTWAEAAKYFTEHELTDVQETFRALSISRRVDTGSGVETHAGIDKETFGDYFSYPGVLRDHLFSTFDTNGDGLVDCEEFLRGMAMCCRGKLEDKLKFCFTMFDLSGDELVDKNELRQCLQSTAFASFALLQAVSVQRAHEGGAGGDDAGLAGLSITPSMFSAEVEMMVEDAFRQSDKNHDGVLSFEEFQHWLLTTPEIVSIIYCVFEMRQHVDTEVLKKEFAEGQRTRLLKRSDTDKRMVELESKRALVHRKLSEARVQHLNLEHELERVLRQTVEARRRFLHQVSRIAEAERKDSEEPRDSLPSDGTGAGAGAGAGAGR